MNGKAIAALIRRTPGMTAARFARECGISKSTVHCAMRSSDCNVSSVREMHRVTHIPYDILIGER